MPLSGDCALCTDVIAHSWVRARSDGLQKARGRYLLTRLLHLEWTIGIEDRQRWDLLEDLYIG